jgi:hypothetical protein
MHPRRSALLLFSMTVAGCISPTFDEARGPALDIFVPMERPKLPMQLVGPRASLDEEYESDEAQQCSQVSSIAQTYTASFVSIGSILATGGAIMTWCADKASQDTDLTTWRHSSVFDYSAPRGPMTQNGAFPFYATWTSRRHAYVYSDGCGNSAQEVSKHDWWNENGGTRTGGPSSPVRTEKGIYTGPCREEYTTPGGGGGGEPEYYYLCYYEDNYEIQYNSSGVLGVYYTGRTELGCEQIWEE